MYSNITKSLFFFGLLFGLLSCQEEKPQDNQLNDSQLLKKTKKKRLFLQTENQYLRIRSTPDIEAPILEVLQPNIILEYLHDSTSFKTEVNFRNRKYAVGWYKVRSRSTPEGWIYSALVHFLPELENKLLAQRVEAEETLILANQNQNISSQEKQELKKPVQKTALLNYQKYLLSLHSNNPKSISLAMQVFERKLVGKSNIKTYDAAFVAFHAFHQKVLKNLNQRPLQHYQSLRMEILRYGKASMQTDSWTRQLGNNGFNFGIKKNKIVLVLDLDFTYRIFYRECSSTMRAYMNQYQIDESTYWFDQQKLLIAPQLLARWVLSWNYFVAKNPNFIWYNDALQRLSNQLSILVMGSEKSPAFDSQNILKPDFKKAYLHIAENYPNSKIGKAFKQYLDLLEQNDWQYNNAIDKEQRILLAKVLN